MFADGKLCAILMAFGVLSARAANYPPIADYGPTNEYGAAVQRSMRWMAESPAERKRTVKVLFYGQSITQQPWSFRVGDWLQERYPNAQVIYTNLAIGGYTSEVLSRIAEADILEFYPDLLIYQNYGNITEIENIIALTRARTTADILIQNEHPLLAGDLSEGTNVLTASTVAARRSYVELPALAEKYDAELCDVRTPWKRYLTLHEMAPSEVLRDQIHPNETGDYLLGEFVKSHLRVDNTFPNADWRRAVETIRMPEEKWNNLSIRFSGNRVDVILSGNGTAPVQVRIDGKRPSEFPELYAFSRPNFYPNAYFPALLHVGKRAPLLEESWTVKVTESLLINGTPAIRYSLTGSSTGFDGEGTSWDRFVSNSGRITLETRDWLMLAWARQFSRDPLPVGHEIKWECRFNGVDEFVPAVVDPTLESTIVLAQGLANGPHTISLEGADTSAIEAIRIYNPLARIQPAPPGDVRIESLSIPQGTLTIRTTGSSRYVIEQTDTFMGPWTSLTAPLTDRTFTTPALQNRQFLRLRKID